VNPIEIAQCDNRIEKGPVEVIDSKYDLNLNPPENDLKFSLLDFTSKKYKIIS